MESTHGRKLYHRAILSCMDEMTRARSLEQLDRRTKITFSLVYEFGHRLSGQTSYAWLVEAVENRLIQKSLCRN